MDISVREKPGADLRDYLAEERTFLACIRTGIALMGFGLVVAHFASPTPRRSLIGARTALLAAFLGAGSLVACSGEPRSLASYIAAICSTPFRSAPAAEAPYLAENVAAMTKMMIDMGIRPSGDVDADFVAMMVPHHQGAIEMARAELRYGHNEQLKRMAQEIIVTQLQEIAAMHLVLGQPLPAGQGDRTVAGDAYVQRGGFK